MPVALQPKVRLSEIVGRNDAQAARAADETRSKVLANPADPAAAQLSRDEFERIKARNAHFTEARNYPGADAKITGLWTGDDKGGLPRMRWKGPGDTETFYMAVKVTGDPRSVVPELWTNLNHGANPSDFEAHPMELDRQEGDTAIYKVTIPVDKIGNFRVSGRVSTSRDPVSPAWTWSGQQGVGDIRFRPRAVEHEAISEQVVHVGLANADASAANISTLRDLIDPAYGKYNLWAIKAAGKNTIRLQPPFRHDRWDRVHPYDTLGSPYATTDPFTIDPRYSRDCQSRGIPSWDVDKQREVANAEFWAVVDKAHELGMKVVLDIALNHSGHNVTVRDLFDDPVTGEQVVRNNFDQITLNGQQADAVKKRLDTNPYGTGEQLFPEMFASRTRDPDGAHSIWDMVGGGNGEWADTKQYNHGAFDWGSRELNAPINDKVTDWYTRILKYWVEPPTSEVGSPKGARRGVDGFRFDHATNLPAHFWEESLTQLQAMVDKPVAVIAEDFNQGDKLRVYADAMESGGYHGLIDAFKRSDINGINGTLNSDYNFETLRGGNHDEERVTAQFGGDLMATGRYLAMIDLMGGITTTVMGDEFGESRKVEFKHQGGVPPVLEDARRGRLPAANVELQQAMARAGRARAEDPSLQTVLRTPLRADSREEHLVAMARHADDRSLPGTLVFTNLANSGTMANKFWLDDETRGRIDPNGWYEARDLMSTNPDANVWGRRIKGSDLLNDGVYAKLAPYQVQALKLERKG